MNKQNFRRFCVIAVLLCIAVLNISAQDSAKERTQDSANIYHFDFNKLKPIVQVFSVAAYDVENSSYGYSFGRAHLGFQYQFNKKWGAKIIIDRGKSTSVGEITVTDADGNTLTVVNSSSEGSCYTMFLKFASLQWKANNRLTLESGAILQNHYITQERFWGLRFVAQTFQDLYWEIPSSDLGFIAYYNINPKVSFDAALTNGEGPRIKQDAFGKVKLAGGLNFNPTEKIQTRIFYHNKQTGTDTLSTEQMISFFAGYKPWSKLRIGGEYNYMSNLNNTVGVKSDGFSIYSAYNIAEKIQIFARYDRLFYNTDNIAEEDTEGDGNTFIGGICYSPVKGINVSMNYQGWIPDQKENDTENKFLISIEYKL